MKDKLVFVKATNGNRKTDVIRVSRDAYDVVSAICADTGQSIPYIASQLILWAAERSEIVENAAEES